MGFRASTDSCIAVGDYAFGQDTDPLVEYWNGSTWTIESAPNQENGVDTDLSGVSCLSSTNCMAVGTYYNLKSDDNLMVAERWNGTKWSAEAPPNPSGTTQSNSGAVSCESPASCTAVGTYYTKSGTERTLAEYWNGSAGAVHTTPNPSGGFGYLLAGVSCPSVTRCSAVGQYGSGGGYVTLAEQWNGTKWSVQKTRNGAGGESSLDAISCTSTTSCTATGSASNNSGSELTLAEYWNGSTWTVQNTPSPGQSVSYLDAVSCTSASSCAATGVHDTKSPGQQVMLAEYWNGSTWVTQSTQKPSGSINSELYGVSCVTANSCTTVGWWGNNSKPEETLAEYR
jgi:hypothetical protein